MENKVVGGKKNKRIENVDRDVKFDSDDSLFSVAFLPR